MCTYMQKCPHAYLRIGRKLFICRKKARCRLLKCMRCVSFFFVWQVENTYADSAIEQCGNFGQHQTVWIVMRRHQNKFSDNVIDVCMPLATPVQKYWLDSRLSDFIDFPWPWPRFSSFAFWHGRRCKFHFENNFRSNEIGFKTALCHSKQEAWQFDKTSEKTNKLLNKWRKTKSLTKCACGIFQCCNNNSCLSRLKKHIW